LKPIYFFDIPFTSKVYLKIQSFLLKKNVLVKSLVNISNKYTELSGYKLDHKWVSYQTIVIKIYYKYFIKMLTRLNPSVIFLVWYHYPIAMALIMAAKDLNIKTVDVQHGVPHIYHPSYFYWKNIPFCGYKLLPDYFWIKGKVTLNQHRETNSEMFLKKHRPILGGELFYSYYKKKLDDIPQYIFTNFINKFKDYKKIILYAMNVTDIDLFSTSHFLIQEHLINVVKHSPKNWLWLFRLHPGYKNNRIDSLIRFFENINVNNIECKIASDIPLISILHHIDYFITSQSSSIFDALHFNIPVAITRADGFIYYSSEVRNGIITYAPNEDNLNTFLNNEKHVNNKIYASHYIETNTQKAISALETILSPT